MENHRDIISSAIIEYSAFEKANDTFDQAIASIESMNNSLALALVGPSRVGKTTVMKHLYNKYPSIRDENGLIQPVIYCCIPSKPSLKGLAFALLQGLKDPTDSIRGNGESGERALKARSIKLIKECGVKAIIFDESQHLTRDPFAPSTYAATEWVKTLIDETNVVMILAGLESTTNLFHQNEQLRGRCMSTIRLNRFDWMEDQSRLQFFGVLAAFNNRMSVFDLPALSEPEMALRFYIATGGLLGYLSKLLTQTVWDAVDAKRLVITQEDFAIAYEKTMRVSDSNEELNPFSKKFKPLETSEMIETAKAVGGHISPPKSRRKH